mmetsp:Transcript_4092/g.8277  ORF Transcript_4092/g.8277 Transcript_4092/m.8277 type:complete len:342 (+) Transcript_4092:373-1398(+)
MGIYSFKKLTLAGLSWRQKSRDASLDPRPGLMGYRSVKLLLQMVSLVVFEGQSSSVTTSSQITRKRLGGEVAEEEQDKWKISIGKNNRSLVHCEFSPIYNLVNPSSSAYDLLRSAYEKFFEPIQHGHYYCIWNQHLHDDRDENLEVKDVVAAELVVSRGPAEYKIRPYPSSHLLKDYTYIQVYAWDADQDQQHMKAAFTNSHGEFLGRTLFRRVCISKRDPFAPRSWTTWYLERVQENVFFIRTHKTGPLLGAWRQADGTIHYILANRHKKAPILYEDVFKWQFNRMEDTSMREFMGGAESNRSRRAVWSSEVFDHYGSPPAVHRTTGATTIRETDSKQQS